MSSGLEERGKLDQLTGSQVERIGHVVNEELAAAAYDEWQNGEPCGQSELNKIVQDLIAAEKDNLAMEVIEVTSE